MYRLRGVLTALLVLTAGPVLAADSAALLEKHLRNDVPYWLAEPRLLGLLRDSNDKSAALDDAALAALEARWQAELEAGSGALGNRVATRFASKYLDEVVLRMDGAYGLLILIDKRGVLVAASETPEHYRYDELPVLRALDADVSLQWLRDEASAKGRLLRFAMPVVDAADGARLGSVLLEIDAERLAPQGSIRSGNTRRKDVHAAP